MMKLAFSLIAASALGLGACKSVDPVDAVVVDTPPVAQIMAQLRDETSSAILVAAHRGAHADAPENSLKAIEDAIAFGVDVVEIDVRVTSDGVPVLMHDASVDRMTDGTGAVEDRTFEQFRALRLRARQGGQDAPLTDMRPPSLQEALRIARGRIAVDLDLKTAALAPIIETVDATETGGQSLWFGSRDETFATVLAEGDEVILMPRVRAPKDLERFCPVYPEAEVLHLDMTIFPDMVSAVKACGARVWMNALGEIDEALAAGDDGSALSILVVGGAGVIQTDEPEKVIAYLESVGRR